MTRANTEQAKYVPWFAKAGAACSIVPIARFVNDNLFALKDGGYGCLFQLSGLDEEGLTDQELESHLRMIEGALRGLPEGACLYQYTRVRSGYDLPRQLCYANPVTHAFVSDRLEFLERTAGFRRIDLHWCLTLEPSKVKSFERTPAENAASTSRILSYWRGLTQVDGPLAKAYLHQGDLHSALTTIDEAIAANQHIPAELYFVPRNLAIKAEITARMGDTDSANRLYEKSEDMLDALLSKVPTPTVERQLLADLGQVYSQHFALLSDEGKANDAFRVIERARGRVEAQSLAHHEVITPHQLNPLESQLTGLNVELLNSDDAKSRAHTLDAIYEIEQQLNPSEGAVGGIPTPIDIRDLQRDLHPSEVFIEYVLDSPQSYALAVTERSIHRYTLPSKDELEKEATQYRAEILQRKEDQGVAQRLFDGLLARIPEIREKQTVIIVPDGRLHLLPFGALVDQGKYLVTSHLMTVAPSGTVFHMLRHRTDQKYGEERPYLGVAAWTMKPPTRATMLASILRSVSGPERKELIALPESQHEVETISSDLPSPNMILLGTRATETNFKQLPLQRYNVIHLALHGYVDPEFPDRSALIFAPQQETTDDSLLQIREIRNLRLSANLVTLSACNTGVGPIGEEGVANIVNAFIEAGSQSVVSTLWELEDHATAHLMAVFYDHLGHHEGKAESLRQAQLEMLNSGDPPYFWAGFVLDGEPGGNLFESSANKVFSRSSQ